MTLTFVRNSSGNSNNTNCLGMATLIKYSLLGELKDEKDEEALRVDLMDFTVPQKIEETYWQQIDFAAVSKKKKFLDGTGESARAIICQVVHVDLMKAVFTEPSVTL